MESRSPEGLRILVKKLNQGPYDRFGGRLPRSPVWLRKIPSTVSGSQGSRRGLRPAVRFAFPLGARLNITLRARPCQELFSESFFRPSRGPRGAPPSGLRPFAAASSILYAPPARRGRETRPHTGCRQLQRGGARGWRAVRARGRRRAGASPPPHRRGRFSFLYISKEIGARLRAGGLPRRRHACDASPIVGFPLLASAKLLAEGAASRKKNGRLGPARLPRGQSPRRPSLVDSLYVSI